MTNENFIDIETFEHLVDLAALELAPDQAEYIRQELNNQLKAIRELVAIPLADDVPASMYGVPYDERNSSVLREDVWQAFEAPQQILGQAPQRSDEYIIVPDIPHTTLE